MENSINKDTEEEVANGVLYDVIRRRFYTSSLAVPTNKGTGDFAGGIREFILEAMEITDDKIKKEPNKQFYPHYGFAITIGKLIHKKFKDIPDTDW